MSVTYFQGDGFLLLLQVVDDGDGVVRTAMQGKREIHTEYCLLIGWDKGGN